MKEDPEFGAYQKMTLDDQDRERFFMANSIKALIAFSPLLLDRDRSRATGVTVSGQCLSWYFLTALRSSRMNRRSERCRVWNLLLLSLHLFAKPVVPGVQALTRFAGNLENAQAGIDL